MVFSLSGFFGQLGAVGVLIVSFEYGYYGKCELNS